MADTNEKGGSHEQHVKAGQQSHKSTGSEGSEPTSGEGRGWHGDSQGHAEAGRKGGEAVSQDRDHMAEIGREGGESRGRGKSDSSSNAQSIDEETSGKDENSRKGESSEGESRGGESTRGGTHEQHVKAGQQSHKNS